MEEAINMDDRECWLHNQREEEDTEQQQRQKGESTAEKGRGGGGSFAPGFLNMQTEKRKKGNRRG